MKKFIKHVLNKILISKLMIITLISSLSLSIYFVLNENIRTLLTSEIFSIYKIYHSIYSYRIVNYLIIPIFLLFIWKSTFYFNSEKVILKYSNSKSWIIDKNITNITLAFTYTILINIPLFTLIALSLSNIVEGIYLNFFIVLAFQIIGFTIIQALYNIFEILINFKNIGFLGVMSLIILIDFGRIGLGVDFNFITEYMSLTYKVNLNNYTIRGWDFLVLAIYLMIFIFMYKMECIAIENKDIYERDKI